MNNSERPVLSEKDFSSIRTMVFENTGISLPDSKMELVKRRFTPRLRALELNSFDSYIKYVKNNQAREIPHFCNAITTNLTSFFRENHHFEILKNTMLPNFLKRQATTKRKLRLWSAGCSTGQEAYCLALTLRSAMPEINKCDVKLLASDLDEKCLAIARVGMYPVEEFEKVSKAYISEYFSEVEREAKYTKKKYFKASSKLKQLITFNKLNLMDKSWPMKEKFDVIFCRNVFIYFNKETQLEMVNRYAAIQSPGSLLCLGHSETIADPKAAGYKLIGKTAYLRL